MFGRVNEMKLRIKSQDGFTLLEVMTSMFIMGFALLLLLHLAMVALDGNKWASGTTTSTQLLQEKLEFLRNMPSPTSGADTVGEVARTWRVTSSATHLKQVDITATWKDHDSIVQSYNIRTLMRTANP
jgi:prepilin-type N-terminal cleavage/methylation domain-containing protein